MSSLLDALIAAEEFPPLKGDRGAKGDVGNKGDKGDTGYQGLEGPTGPMGPDGPVGPGGPEGPEGKRGPKGLKGDTGDKGDKGDEGPAGRDGGVAGGRGYNVRGFASGMVIDDEGTKLNGGAVVGEIDYAGAGVSVAMSGGKAVVTIPGSSGSGLPAGGSVGQVVTNTGPGAGDWEDASGLPPQWTDGGNGDVTATVDAAGKVAITVEQFEAVTPVLNLKAIAPASTDGENLLRIIDENGDEVGRWEANGRLFVKNADWSTSVGLYPEGFLNLAEDPLTYPSPYVINVMWGGQALFRIYAPGNGYVGRLIANDPADIGFAFEATTAQSADLAVFRDEDGLDAFRVDKDGRPVVGVVSAPADGDLAASQAAVWFDDTNGAASPKWKGKSADGTVVSGSLGGGTASFLSIAKWT